MAVLRALGRGVHAERVGCGGGVGGCVEGVEAEGGCCLNSFFCFLFFWSILSIYYGTLIGWWSRIEIDWSGKGA